MILIFVLVSFKGYKDVKQGKDKHEQRNYDEDIDAAEYNKASPKLNKKASIMQEIKQKGCFHYFKRWAIYVWAIRSMYAAAAVHIYDISTDIGVILEWWLLAYQQTNVDNWPLTPVYAQLDMTVLFIAALVALNIYRSVHTFLNRRSPIFYSCVCLYNIQSNRGLSALQIHQEMQSLFRSIL